jgi:hypothetical protein
MISAVAELQLSVATLEEDEAEEALVVLRLLFDEETRQEVLDLIRKLAPEFFGS